MLNKHGWGLRQMLLLIGLLALFFLVAVYYISSLTDYMKPSIPFDYSELEQKLENQAKIYLDNYYDSNLTSNYITIKRSVLDSYNLGVLLLDEDNDECTGYVKANKTRGIVSIKAYIKCDKYITEGYEEWRDK